jgi:DNA-3-methyladenine glycosylase
MAILPQSFYARDALEVAADLLGKRLRHGPVEVIITEVEAYPPGDSASHCRAGRTARNAPMWGPPGHVYMYLCYGLHHMLNIVTNVEGEGAAVLVRACAPSRGLSTIRARRGGRDGPVLLTGPGKVSSALGLDLSFSTHPLYRSSGLTVHDGDPPDRIVTGPRVGIDFAEPRDLRAHRRFATQGSAWVSAPRRGLRAMAPAGFSRPTPS